MNTHRQSRRSIRLKNHDYSLPGGYFLTWVTFQREHLFGEITDGEMHLNEAGRIIWDVWEKLPVRFPNVILDEMVIMPNHFHGIVFITDEATEPVEAAVAAVHELPLQIPPLQIPPRQTPPLQTPPQQTAPQQIPPPLSEYESPEEYRLRRRRMLLPKLVGYYKMNTAKAINLLLHSSGVPVWQRNYYEHIIRSKNELDRIRNYIHHNPQQWAQDDENR
jgi:putative transposase